MNFLAAQSFLYHADCFFVMYVIRNIAILFTSKGPAILRLSRNTNIKELSLPSNLGWSGSLKTIREVRKLCMS